MTIVDWISLLINVIFATFEITKKIVEKKAERLEINQLVATHNMAIRLSESLTGPQKQQAMNLADNLKSLIKSCKGETWSELKLPKGGGKNGKV